MSLENIAKNLKEDLYNILEYTEELREYISLNNLNTSFNKAVNSILKQFIDALESLTYLISFNYEAKEKLNFGRVTNLDGVFINARKIIESSLIMNIILTNNELYSIEFLEQYSFDYNHVNKMFNSSSQYIKPISKRISRKYDWIKRAGGSKVISIDDLIAQTKIAEDIKIKLKAWINECNYMSHPNLYSDAKVYEVISNIWILDLRYVFNIVLEIMYSFYYYIDHIESKTQYRVNYDVKSIRKKMNPFTIFNSDFITRDLTKTRSMPNEHKLNDFSYLIGNSIPYAVRAELSMLNGVLNFGSNDKFGERKKRTLSKLIDDLGNNVRDMLLGYYKSINGIYYTKCRQVLENISYIYIILNMSEDDIGIYQSYIDIKRYSNHVYKLKLYENDSGSELYKYNKQIIELEDQNITVEKYYYKSLKNIKEIFVEKYGQNVKTKKIKQSNSWLYDGFKIPSNWEIIKQMLESINDKSDINIDYFNGLYSISSLYSHINDYSNNELLTNDEFKNETFRAVIKPIEIIFNILLSYTPEEFQDIILKSENETGITRILKDLN